MSCDGLRKAATYIYIYMELYNSAIKQQQKVSDEPKINQGRRTRASVLYVPPLKTGLDWSQDGNECCTCPCCQIAEQVFYKILINNDNDDKGDDDDDGNV